MPEEGASVIANERQGRIRAGVSSELSMRRGASSTFQGRHVQAITTIIRGEQLRERQMMEKEEERRGLISLRRVER